MTRSFSPLTEVILTLPAPVPASRARSNGARRFHVATEPYAVWRAAAEPLVRRAWPRPPLAGPVELLIAAILPRPENRPSWCPKDVWAAGGRFRHAPERGPDWDNFGKAVSDAIQMRAELRKVRGAVGYPVRDDGQVAAGRVEKWIASSTEAARTVVLIRGIGWVA